MTSVKRPYDQTLDLDDFEPKHFGFLLDQVTRRMRHDLAELDGAAALRRRHEPLTPAYYRLLALVPGGGARITDLAGPANMTKQALGQFIDVLMTHGYVTLQRSKNDGRARIVERTKKGDRLVHEVELIFDRLREHHRAVLGARRADQLYALLGELATGWGD